MSIINKAHWSTEGDNVRLSMPFAKVDKERRIVSGFATLDNLDRQNDIVTTDASLKAFSKFRGNIRSNTRKMELFGTGFRYVFSGSYTSKGIYHSCR